MALTLDITSDYLIFDNKETITFQNQGESAITIPNVIRRPAVIGVDGGGGSIVYGAGIEFLVFKNELANALVADDSETLIATGEDSDFLVYSDSLFAPRINARITDENGKHYRVDIIDDGAYRTRWAIRATSEAAEGIN